MERIAVFVDAGYVFAQAQSSSQVINDGVAKSKLNSIAPSVRWKNSLAA
jgi:hypothetical protein